ncbi:hypothetical protein [Malaciobacter mytili]|uniref:Uncharacterized protein n=1 Tax=Malaciobacter mytili LMG 24559 TaxID=1032238 RepID=A0AAX2AKQ2_9BACT|nr:hypothetical protein [Malaciobacter mytili]AXH14060.1 hypothetical protein AMYT_0452 [Malaciobacter mytili LMG 24559]RXI43443.1 hypothetical protein CRU99_07510 [Malaciobacter mytili]RXK16939.1 hypothetical protein CP985_00530 [Malaciobacter mytili LMG 24559]
MKSKPLLIIAFFIIFMFLSIFALKESMPSYKNKRVYTILENYIPYIIEKRAGGLSIVDKTTGVKEKPPAKQVFLRLEQLEKMWGKEFLKLDKNILIIYNKDKKEVTKITLKTDEELNWVREYFQLK